MSKRDIVVVGGSAGAIDVLKSLVRELPADFEACLAVVVHASQDSAGYLAGILNVTGVLPATVVASEARVEPGRIYVPRSGRHLSFWDTTVRAVAGPRENRFRPAIDVLFRSAAEAYGPRVIGVLLTGYLDDGISGLGSIKEAGGTVVVQDPRDAYAASMPENALENVDVDYCVPAAGLPELLVHLTSKELAGREKREMEAMPNQEATSNHDDDPPSRYTCPDCGGTLFEVMEGKVKRFRCRVGHAFSERSLLVAQDTAVENLLWAAQRALEERADMLEKLASRYGDKSNSGLQRKFTGRAKQNSEQARRLRDLLEAEAG